MFDNSEYLRTNLAIWTNYDFFKREIGGVENKTIAVKPYKSAEDYFHYQFNWIDLPVKFEMQVHAIRPQISAIYNLTWIKVI